MPSFLFSTFSFTFLPVDNRKIPLHSLAPTCNDGLLNQGEADIDCGGPCTPNQTCNIGQHCNVSTDCTSGICNSTNRCDNPTCNDGLLNQGEADIDCGGPCTSIRTCDIGQHCNVSTDCTSGICNSTNQCDNPTCNDGLLNQGEADIDCGGPCTSNQTCNIGQNCNVSTDCTSGICNSTDQCDNPTCNDGLLNQGEADIDCGGPCTSNQTCNIGQHCNVSTDCTSGICNSTNQCDNPTCNDGLLNQGEADTDCGGPCTSIRTCDIGQHCNVSTDCTSGICNITNQCDNPTCNDGLLNQGEADTDCGGPCTPIRTCDIGQHCNVSTDCTSGICNSTNQCDNPTCNDGLLNQGEADIDCGGPCTPIRTCDIGQHCNVSTDCTSGICNSTNQCDNPTCNDGLLNQGEADTDCGGPCTPIRTCDIGQHCNVSTDCTSGICNSTNQCDAPTCNDGLLNQGEADTDCGGPCTPIRTCDI
ncbi:unnamed protein product, partial [Rotaria sordida]